MLIFLEQQQLWEMHRDPPPPDGRHQTETNVHPWTDSDSNLHSECTNTQKAENKQM